ncbi:hypothetical protein RHSIM_Rhsim06G0033100 [Rhododendron simsii]|uniref:Uncharacterized protein n=1 Tax=Rhododendron simsii TaxID=118357 RepID=A0A834LIT0_RHOSS|nr:hypothetical protein RHSIM_Rhsim06G0033100 [Rhododendron simsii]
MATSRIQTLLKKPSPLSYLLRTFCHSSCSSSSLFRPAANPKPHQFFSDDAAEGGSSVYRHTLKFQRPSTIKWRKELFNSVSFIGTVDRPPKQVKSVIGFGAYTLINVKTSPDSNHFLRILLKMWDEMAEISIKHLKPGDCVYVSGHLQLHTKIDENGKLNTSYQGLSVVAVEEMNYVVQCGQGLSNKKSEPSDSGDGETGLEKYKERLHLWQVFFTNPSGWLDYRRRKSKPNHPDFKNKDTGEALWISRYDPPWIKRQLQMYDSRLAEQRGLGDYPSSRSSLSPMVYDD